MAESGMLPYFTPGEVALHNSEHDCWVSILGKVYAVTRILRDHDDHLAWPLLAFAGKDISHWFDPKTGDPNTCVHPRTGVRVAYMPHGHIPDSDSPTAYPLPMGDLAEREPWWKSDDYVIGLVTKRARRLKVLNRLTARIITLTVCSEDTFNRITERIKMFMSTPEDYAWRRLDGEMINMNGTMEENGMPDETEELNRLGMPASMHIPLITLEFKDERGMTDDSDSDSSFKDTFLPVTKKKSSRLL